MLPAAHRLRSSAEFAAVVRRGRRAARPLLTVHLLQGEAGVAAADMDRDMDAAPPRAGLVVSKAVGGSVVRHRTARRLRHLLVPHVMGAAADVPLGARVVVRAAPAAGAATSAALGADLDAALARLLRTDRTSAPTAGTAR